MFKKMMTVLAVLLVCLLAISAVSAQTDAAITDSSTDGVESTDEVILGSSETDELENDNEPSCVDAGSGKLEMGEGEVLGKDINVTGDSFTDIEIAMDESDDGDIIYLQGGNFTGNGNQLVIDKRLTIIGGFESGDGIYATLDAQKLSRILMINLPVTLQGIKFINGYSSDDGGAIYMNTKCTLIDCIFVNNSALGSGGAIFWQTAGDIIDCSFENNYAGEYGGANYFKGIMKDVVVSGNFTGNRAEYAGGANYFKDDVTNVNLTGNFTNNSAEQLYGGANYFYDPVTNVILSGNFANNSAHDYGGANFFSDEVIGLALLGNFTGNFVLSFSGGANYFARPASNVNLTANFINNTARNGNGGANYFYDEVTNIAFLGNFTGNAARANGGANYFYEEVTNATLLGNFNSNNAKNDGGANYFKDDVSNIDLLGNFTGNFATVNGGANFFNGAVTNATLSGDFSSNNAQKEGGANHFNNTVTNIALLGNFTDNHVWEYGGANYFDGAVTNIALSGNFINNSVKNGFGGVNYFRVDVTYGNFSGNFTDNFAGESGGVNCFIGDVTNVTMSGDFINNSAVKGGVNYFDLVAANVSLTGNFTDNFANDGGVNYFYDVTNVTMSGNFINNTVDAEDDGGGVNYFNGKVTNLALSGNFINNTANDGFGGVNYFDEDVTNFIMSGNFTDNFAWHDGAVNSFYLRLINGSFSGNFINNRAERNGGVNDFADDLINFTLSGNFINNTAGYWGGVNDFYYPVYNVNLTGVFINNTADKGSVHYFEEELTNVTITGNYINNTGASVIHIANSVSGNVIRDSIFINNGPINVNEGSIDAFDNWFGNNVTDYDVEPDVGIELDNWLFLNGTADPNPVSAAESSNVIFNLSRYDGEEVSSYDNSRLIPINLTVTSTRGGVNKNKTGLDESITYSPNSSGTGSITASFENVVCTIEMENQIADPELEANFEDNITYGEDAVLLIKINENATGYVEVYDVDGAEPVLIANVTVEEALKGINITGLNAGNHSFNISYTGDERFLESESNATLSVEKADVILTAEKIEMYVGDGSKLKVVLTDSNGKPLSNRGVKVNIAGKTYTIITNASGVAVLPINLKAGSYTVSVWFNGDSNYNPSDNVSTSVEVYVKSRITGNKDLVKKQGGSEPFKVRALDKYGKPVGEYAKVQMTVAGKTYTVFTDANGYASLPINLKVGTYKITTVYGGTTVTNTITVKK